MRKARRTALAFALLTVILIASPHGLPAQDEAGSGGLRERLRQRWDDGRQDSQPARPRFGPAVAITAAGDHEFSIVHDGLRRRYRLHLPRSYRAASPAPLLLAFHGGGGDMNYMATDRYYGLISKSEVEGFVVVFPNGFSKLPSGRLATWNAGTCCAAARDDRVDDVGFVRKIVGDVSGRLNIDRQRIYASGMSNGAMMAYRLACEMADTFKAVAAVAGTDNTTHCAPSASVSILHIHARNDERVRYDGGAGKGFGDPSKLADFSSVATTVAKWVRNNACKAVPQPVLQTRGAYCERYGPCQANSAVELCVTETGGHSWPGGYKPRGDEAPSTAINANDVMWAFFESVAVSNGDAAGQR